jgi:hypothetical protein
LEGGVRYRKKPIVIEAFQPSGSYGEQLPDWLREALDDERVEMFWQADAYIGANVKTLEGSLNAMPGDWIIRGVKGELYPCKPDIFAATYEAAE